MGYREKIAELILDIERRAKLGVAADIVLKGRAPTMATSEFLINREQGDWAENVVLKAVNEQSNKYFAVRYGNQDSRSAGDDGFAAFYAKYQEELNTIGKKPDLLIYRRSDFDPATIDIGRDEIVRRAVAAIEVRSSSFLEKKYRAHSDEVTARNMARCRELRAELLSEPYASLLKAKSAIIYKYLEGADDEALRNIIFRRPSWRSTVALSELTEKLSEFHGLLKLLQKRDFLSITPKVEDIALVNRWISVFNVPHFYCQVFFDGAYALSFERILRLVANPDEEDRLYSIEKDKKNQEKTTVKVSVRAASNVLPTVEMPGHSSEVKELARGRLIFFVKFDGGNATLDEESLDELVSA